MSIYALRKCASKCQSSSAFKTSAQFLTIPKPSASHAVCALCVLGPCRARHYIPIAMAKRKSLSTATQGPATTTVPILPPPFDDDPIPPPKRRASQRKVSRPKANTGSTNPDKNANVLDAPEALRASPDGDETMNLEEAGMDVEKQVKEEDSDSPLSEMQEVEEPVEKRNNGRENRKSAAVAKKGIKEESRKPALAAKKKNEPAKEPQFLDPEAEGDEEADEEEIQAALSRPPPVNSDYLPLPWKGRIGYVSFAYATDNSRPPLNVHRLVYVHICASRILLYSALEPVVLHLY